MFFGLYTKIAAAAVLAIALAGLVWKVRHSGIVAGRAEVQQKWDAERVEMQKQAAAALAKSVQVTADLQAKSDALRRAKNAQIDSIGLELAESLKRLRNRPERPNSSDVPTVAGTGPSASNCTGAQLYKGDGEFLAGLAADADRLRAALNSCQQAYENARAVK